MSLNTIAQQDSISLHSRFFNESRNLRVAVCAQFNQDKPYHVYVVLDEEFLFDYTVSTLKYISQWKEVPQYVVLGIPNKDRWNELLPVNTPIEQLPFYQFLQQEVDSLPMIRQAAFRTIIGHSLSARFALHYFFRHTSYYRGAIAISPPLIPILRKEFETFERQNLGSSYVYTCSGDQDLRFHKDYFQVLRKQLKHSQNPHTQLEYFQEQPYMTHTLMPVTAIKNGLLFVLDDFFNLPSREIAQYQKMRNPQDSLLENAYSHIRQIYGVVPEVRKDDYYSFVNFYLDKHDFTEAHRLTDQLLAFVENSDVYDLIDACFLKGGVFEKEKHLEEALNWYEKGYALLPGDVLNKADFESEIIHVRQLIAKARKQKD